MNVRKFLLAWIAILLTIIACGSPTPEPRPRPAPVTEPPQAPGGNLPTDPPETEPPATEPPATEPPETEPPATEPPETQLPPIPEFDDLLYYSGGGGGGRCPGVDQEPNTIDLSQFGQAITTCFWLKGFDRNQPFRVSLIPLDAPGGRELVTPELSLDLQNERITGGVYESWVGLAVWKGGRNGTLAVYNFNVWSPYPFAPGKWRFLISQENSSFEFWRDFEAEGNGNQPYVTSLNGKPDELMPYESLSEIRYINPRQNGHLDVFGMDFPPGIPVYILLYREISSSIGQMELVGKFVTISNSGGQIALDLPGPFEQGQAYLVVALSDPDKPFVDANQYFERFDESIPFDRFVAARLARVSSANTCPGAPPQQLKVGLLGYVCTKSDAVLLRASPSRAGDKLEALSPGEAFQVIGGPVCADDWSWWQVEMDWGAVGWIAEGGDQVDPYFICPLP